MRASPRGSEFTVEAFDEAVLLRFPCSAPCKLDHFDLSFLLYFFWLKEGTKAMKASRFTDAQKAFIVKQSTG